jgi:hypothetical protein
MKLKVRVAQKTKLKGFRRCGLDFTREWTEVEVEDAVGRRLMAEQMLEAEILADAPPAPPPAGAGTIPEPPSEPPSKPVAKGKK